MEREGLWIFWDLWVPQGHQRTKSKKDKVKIIVLSIVILKNPSHPEAGMKDSPRPP
jgi:hypothetical protein